MPWSRLVVNEGTESLWKWVRASSWEAESAEGMALMSFRNCQKEQDPVSGGEASCGIS